MFNVINKFALSSVILGLGLTLTGCNKEESSAVASENNYLCIITSNQYLAPSSLATEVYRGYVKSKAECDAILADFQAGRRTS